MPGKIKAVGSRAEVYHQTAKHTSGGLKKSDLMMHKGRIVSRKAHAAGKKAIKRLRALGYVAKKGTFRLFRKGDAKMSMSRKSRRRSTRRRRGGFVDPPSVSQAVQNLMGAVSTSTAAPNYGNSNNSY
jgi:hypothetical protein